MNVKAISFNKTGYDPFIDFLKAYSIICVVVAHILPANFYKYILFQVWGDMQVPMFVLIQVFHAYKKGIKPKLNWESLFKRIFIPFVAVQVVITGFKALMQGGVTRNLLITNVIGGGRTGFLLHLDIPSDSSLACYHLAVDEKNVNSSSLIGILDYKCWI